MKTNKTIVNIAMTLVVALILNISHTASAEEVIHHHHTPNSTGEFLTDQDQGMKRLDSVPEITADCVIVSADEMKIIGFKRYEQEYDPVLKVHWCSLKRVESGETFYVTPAPDCTIIANANCRNRCVFEKAEKKETTVTQTTETTTEEVATPQSNCDEQSQACSSQPQYGSSQGGCQNSEPLAQDGYEGYRSWCASRGGRSQHGQWQHQAPAQPVVVNNDITLDNSSSSVSSVKGSANSTVGTTTTVGATGGSVTAPPAPAPVVTATPTPTSCPPGSAATTTGDPNHPILTATGGSTGYSTDPNGNPVATANPSPTPLPVETRDAARAAASKTKVAAQPAKVANAAASVATPATAENRSAVLASTPRTAAVVKPTVASTTSSAEQPKLRQTNGGLAAQVRAKLAGGQTFRQAYRGTVGVGGNTSNSSLRSAVQRNLRRSMRNTSASNVRPAVQRQTRNFRMSAPRQQQQARAGGGGRRR